MSLIDVYRACMANGDKLAWLDREGIDRLDFTLLVAHVVQETEAAVSSGAMVDATEALWCAVAASFQTAWEASKVAPR